MLNGTIERNSEDEIQVNLRTKTTVWRPSSPFDKQEMIKKETVCLRR